MKLRPDDLDLLRGRLRHGDPAGDGAPSDRQVDAWRRALLAASREPTGGPRLHWLAAVAAVLLVVAGLVSSRWTRSGSPAADIVERTAETSSATASGEPTTRPASVAVPAAQGAQLAEAGDDPSAAQARSALAMPAALPKRGPAESTHLASTPPQTTLAASLLADSDLPPTQLQMVTPRGTRIIWLLRRETEI